MSPDGVEIATVVGVGDGRSGGADVVECLAPSRSLQSLPLATNPVS